MQTTSFLQSKMAARRQRLRNNLRGHALPAAPPSFRTALTDGDTVALIAEFKRRSPSGGQLITDAVAAELATCYTDNGARAVSVLTDAEDFGGSLQDLQAAARASGAPCLRKDFLVDASDLYDARQAGAAAVLLIVAALEPAELYALLQVANEIALDCLVEVHSEAEAERALAAGARIIGINNRDLHSLQTDLATTERIAPLLPAGTIIVSESGIRSADDVARMRDAGSHAVLVGESILRTPPHQRAAKIQELARVSR